MELLSRPVVQQVLGRLNIFHAYGGKICSFGEELTDAGAFETLEYPLTYEEALQGIEMPNLEKSQRH